MTPITPEWAKIDPATVAIPFFLVFVILEMFLVRRNGQKNAYEAKDLAATLLTGVGSVIFIGLTSGVAVASWTAAYKVRLFDIGWTWWAMLSCFLVSDFIYYWAHRTFHERRFWWAFHVVHHSSQHFNLATTFRQEWTTNLSLIFVTKLPLLYLGFPPDMLIFFASIIGVYQFWIHTEQVKSIGPLEWVLNTASHHRVHHATNPRYLDSNHGGVLIIWDRMFGTFVAEHKDDPCQYGIVNNLGTYNVFDIVFHEWIAMGRDVMKARSFREVIGYVFGPPGWSPDGSRETSRDLKAKWARDMARPVPAE